MLKHPELTETRARRTLERIEKLIYFRQAPLKTEIWNVRGEPVPCEKAFQAIYEPFKVGDRWGSRWDTVWFRFRGQVPEEWKGEEVVALVRLANQCNEGFTAEGLIYQDGRPMRALNIHRREVELFPTAKGGEVFEFFVEAAANSKPPEFDPSLGLNMPEYNGGPIHRLDQAELACVNRAATALHYDFKVALEALDSLPADSQRRGELRFALNEAVNAFSVEDTGTISAARAALNPVMAKRNGETVHTVSAVGHAHIDTAWLWPLRETIRKCARTFSTALDYMERYPEYVFVCSQAQQYAWMKAYYPTIWEGIKKAIKRGQWEPVGSMWIECDCNLVSGESLVRQILHGKNFFRKEFGYETRDVWIPDVFGYAASLPQIMCKANIEYFLTQKISWNQFNKFPHQTFEWEGLDGTRIFTHFPPADTYNADAGPKELIKAINNFKEHDRASRSILVYGYGDGGGGPSIEMLEKLRRVKDFYGVPKTVPEKAITFFEKAKADAKDLPVWTGELYLELHRGTYTTQARNKRGNRKSEFLLRDAELLDALSFALVPNREESASDPARAVYDVTGFGEGNANTHRAALERAWKLVLLNQFHDIIPGSSIHWVYEDSARDYETVRILVESVRDSSWKALESRIATEGYKKPIVVINTVGFERNEVISLPGGEVVKVDVPACGYVVVEKSAEAQTQGLRAVKAVTCPDGITLENGLVRVTIDLQGRLTSVFDLVARREALSAPGNVLHLHEDIPNAWDAWDVDVFYKEKCRVLNGIHSIKLVENTPLRATVQLTRSFESSSLTQRIVLRAGSARIDFPTEIEWQETQKILKVAFPVNIRAMTAKYEIQFGCVERPTHTNTSWDMGRFEVCGHKWAELAEPGYGIALLNDCKYGYDIQGNVMRLSLLRAPISPDPVADKGHHEFTYALLPHAGDFRDGQVIHEAYALNVPLLTREMDPHPGSLPPIQSFFSVDRPGAIIEAVKVAEEGDAIIVRLYESEGARGAVRISSSLPLKKVSLADVLEKNLKPMLLKNGAVTLDLIPFEIVTLRFEL
jgi:alpha-mannosidase